MICLQGGAELQPGCEEMDTAVLAAAGPGPVRIAAFAGRPGRERQVAGQNALRWYRALGAGDVAVVEAEEDLPAALDGAALLVLPGGSPARLLGALRPHREHLVSALEAGLAISGASAGAMVLCRWTVLPEGHRRTEAALGLADVDLVLPHYSGSGAWLKGAADVLPDGARVLGLPERSGLLLTAAGEQMLGVSPVSELTVPR